MKKNKEISKSQIRLKGDSDNIRGWMSKGSVILSAVVCLFVGFILRATVVILKTNRELKVAISAGEPEKNRPGNYEEEIQLSR